MAIIIDPYTIPEKGKVDLDVKRSFEIKTSAEEAQQKVRRWLRDEVSMLIDADPATLVVGEQIVWRVPIWIGFPHTGRADVVSAIDVDVTTGMMNITPDRKVEIVRQAEAVASRQPPFRPKEVPGQYLAEHVPYAPKLRVLEDGTLVPASQIEEQP